MWRCSKNRGGVCIRVNSYKYMHMDSKVEITTPGLFRPVLLCLCLCLCTAFSLSPLTSHLSLSAQTRAPAQVPLAQVGTGPPGKVSWSKSSLPRNSGAPKHPLSLEQTWKSLGAATIHSISRTCYLTGKEGHLAVTMSQSRLQHISTI